MFKLNFSQKHRVRFCHIGLERKLPTCRGGFNWKLLDSVLCIRTRIDRKCQKMPLVLEHYHFPMIYLAIFVGLICCIKFLIDSFDNWKDYATKLSSIDDIFDVRSLRVHNSKRCQKFWIFLTHYHRFIGNTQFSH